MKLNGIQTNGRTYVLMIAMLFAAAGTCRSQETADPLKERLEQAGINLEIAYTGEFWANAKGGMRTGRTHLHKIDISSVFDPHTAGLWNNGKFHIEVLSDMGGKLLSECIVGDSQVASNIEAPHSTRLYQFYYEHSLANEKLTLLAGIHDLNSEFAVTETGSLFINSSFGISRDISGGARPGIFPLASPAVRAKYAPNAAWEFLAGIYNGNPGDPVLDRHFPRFAFDGRDGALLIFEGSHRFGNDVLPGTVKAGFWHNTGAFDDLSKTDDAGDSLSHKGNEGLYLIVDKSLYRRAEARGLNGFLQLGWTPDKGINEYNSYIGGGLRFTGFIPRRHEDEVGIAAAHALLCPRLVKKWGRQKAETTLEFTYHAKINKHIALQPDLQIVFNPGANSALANAVVAGLRYEFLF